MISKSCLFILNMVVFHFYCELCLTSLSVLVAQLVERPPGYTYVFAKGVSDQVRDPLTPRNSLQ